MKILVIQLARLGDILMTWPQIRALKRVHPNAEIDLLVRPRFQEATNGLAEIRKVILFPVENIFEPLFDEPLNLDHSLEALDSIVGDLNAEQYDWIINSTLSPASSYLTHALQRDQVKITGYSRTSDGYLSITDDVSAYIYAQVGTDRNNRIHVADLFTLMVEAQPLDADWNTPVGANSPAPMDEYIVVHIGASRADKKLSAFKWRTFISHFQKLCKLPIVLIGSENERKDSEFASLGFNPNEVLDLTGKLTFTELFPLIAKAKLYIGCDSAPLHIASLVNTPALNISFASVSFWETGPKSVKSRVLYAEGEADLASERIATEAHAIINDIDPTDETIFYVSNSAPSYRAPQNCHNQDWVWSLIEALYMDSKWPDLRTNTQRQGLQNLYEVNRVIIDQLETIKKTKTTSVVSSLIERCEEVIESIGNLVPELSPLIRWYQTHKIQIGPGTPLEILKATEKVHLDFDAIIQFWLTNENNSMEALHESPQS